MKSLLTILIIAFFVSNYTYAQNGAAVKGKVADTTRHAIQPAANTPNVSATASSASQTGHLVLGTVTDTAKHPIPAVNVILVSDQRDSLTAVTDTAGKFSVKNIKGTRLTVTLAADGFEAIRKHYALNGDTGVADLGVITLTRRVSATTGAAANYTRGGHFVRGVVIDTTKQPVPAVTVTLTSDLKDSINTVSDLNGKFTFPTVKGSKIAITVSSIGFQTTRKHFALAADSSGADVGAITIKTESKMLKGVVIVGTVPVRIVEDTVEYKASAYKVRENAPVEDLIKKLPGVDVDVNGNITTQGKQVTKVRINGKDFMGGDVQSATKNLPADVVENIQMIDDYGDQANLTGVKTGEPDKIMNITIRQDKNYGYFGQATVGDGEDALPASQGIPDQNRYLATVNLFDFNGNRQIAVLGSINNTNVNTFSFGAPGGGGGRGGGGFGGGGFGGGGFGGGGRGNAARGFQNNGSLITTQNGITDAHYIGTNFRDQWGKYLSVYGSYSFGDNTTTTNSSTLQQNNSVFNPTTQQQQSVEKDENINHRFTWNMEYKPDTINYLKVTPTFSWAGTNTNESESVNFSSTNTGSPLSVYNETTSGYSHAPNYGFTALYNHRFPHRNNFNINFTFSSSPTTSFQNPVYDFLAGSHTAPANQLINTYSRTNSYGTSLSYLLPVGKLSYLELNYNINYAVTNNNQQTDTLYNVANSAYRNDNVLSNLYNYTFTTNKAGINYRYIDKKYNYTLGLAAQEAGLNGSSPMLQNSDTHVSAFDLVPTARFIYNFSRSRNFSVNYNASSSAPAFTQLQPVINFSNALYPVEGNPDLRPQYTNNFSIRYNNFSFQSGDIFFVSLQYSAISNYVATNSITYPRHYRPDSVFNNTILTQYLNTNGYNTTSAQVTYAKPWDNRKFTLYLRGTMSYAHNVGFLSSIDSVTYAETTEKNISKNLQFTPQVQFRVDITDVIDVQLLTNYSINSTTNTVQDALTQGSEHVRTWNTGLNGKNYFGDWTFSYDYTHATNYGYAPSLHVNNPNILNVYVERRFLKDHRGTIRLSAFDLFNQNTGFTETTNASSITESHVNRLARYYLATFTLRLEKFAGKRPDNSNNPMRGFRRDGGGGGRNGSGNGGPGGD